MEKRPFSRKICNFFCKLVAFWGRDELPAASSPSQALPRQLSRRESQAVKFIAKVLGAMRNFPAVLLALPLRKDFPRSGGRCRAATKGGICQARQGLTERAHAVSPVAEVSNAMKNFSPCQRPLPALHSSPQNDTIAAANHRRRTFFRQMTERGLLL